jgi:hypothetical protein
MNRFILGLSMAVATALAGTAGGQESYTVYYQVVYADGSVRDENVIPAANEGIRRVVRIATVSSAGKSYQVLSTGPEKVGEIAVPQTTNTDMEWNGKAWVALVPPHPVVVVLSPMPITTSMPTSAPATRPASLSPLGPASGTVCFAPAGTAGTGEIGVVAPKSVEMVLPHHVQVWPLPAGNGSREITVSLPHSQAGLLGAFYYVAYADTDGDGSPDHLIACSPLATAEQAGVKSSWTFSTDCSSVFVGNAWDNPDTGISCRSSNVEDGGVTGAVGNAGSNGNGDESGNGTSVGSDVFISGIFGGMPCNKKSKWPFIGTIHVRTGNQNPD